MNSTATIATTPANGPISDRAISASDCPLCRTDATSTVKSCTAPANTAPLTIQSKPGAKQGTDFDFQQLTNNDPRTMLDFLRAASADIETVGSEELRGEDTTHYRATIEPREYAKLAPLEKREELQSLVQQMGAQSGLTTIPVEVWLDADGLVRKLSFEFSATQPGSSERSDASIMFELWDYGKDVAIELPPASEVVDASAVRS